MNSALTVTATEFAKSFGEVHERAQRGPVRVSRHGRTAGVYLSADAYEALMRKAIAADDLSDPEFDQIFSGEMNARHAHLDAIED